MHVLKFGGSSLATPSRVRDVGRIVLDAHRRGPIIVVVSAFQGVTNHLLESAQIAERGNARYDRILNELARRHRTAARRLVARRTTAVLSAVDRLLADLENALHGAYLLRHCPPQALDLIASFGERLSALIIAAHLNQRRLVKFVDAREFVVTDDQFTHAAVIFDKTNRAARAYFSKLFARGKKRFFFGPCRRPLGRTAERLAAADSIHAAAELGR